MFPFSFLNGIIFCLNPDSWYKKMNPLVDKYLEGKPVPEEHYEEIRKETQKKAITQILMFVIYVTIQVMI